MLDNYSYLLLFRGNNGYANAPECYVYTYSACLVEITVVLVTGAS